MGTDLENQLIRLGSEREDLRPHIRRILIAVSWTMYALVDARRGELLGASDDDYAASGDYWGRQKPRDWMVFRLKGVPHRIAERLVNQGTDSAWYGDPREAYEDAKSFIDGVTDRPEYKAVASLKKAALILRDV